MSKRLKAANLQGNFKKRALVVGHHDLDGIMSCILASLYLDSMGYDTLVYYDISPVSSMTDEIIDCAVESINNLSMNMYDKVFIVDRDACTENMAKRLIASGVDEIIHIDHHRSNRGRSVELAKRFPQFTSVYEEGDNFEYSANYLVRDYFSNIASMNPYCPSYEVRLTKDSDTVAKLDKLVMLSDLYDVFKWTKEDVSEYGKKAYEGFNTKLIDFETIGEEAVSLNYVFKFMDSEMFYELALKSLREGEHELMNAMNPIIERFKYKENKCLDFINFSYNDAVEERVNSSFKSFIKSIIVDKVDGVPRTARVLYMDKPLEFDVSSVASYRFLKEHKDVILVFKSNELSHVFSVRSTGDIPTLAISSKLNGGGHTNASGFSIDELRDSISALRNKSFDVIEKKIEEVCLDSTELLER